MTLRRLCDALSDATWNLSPSFQNFAAFDLTRLGAIYA
eukprot:g14871.t1